MILTRLALSLLFTSLLCTCVRAQKTAVGSAPGLQYHLGYFGNFGYQPGLKFGAERGFSSRTTERDLRSRRETVVQTITKTWFWSGDVGFYLDPRNHAAAFTTWGVTRRRSLNPGGELTWRIAPVGYARTFLTDTYEVTNGTVERVPLAGNDFYVASFLVGYGRQRPQKRLRAWFLNLNLMLWAPHNTNLLPVLALEYGYRL